jgi:hypothetical protein
VAGAAIGRPAAAVGLLTFDLLDDFVCICIEVASLYTLPVGLRQLQQLDRSNWPRWQKAQRWSQLQR